MVQPDQPLATKFTQDDVASLAHKILDLGPDPVPRYLILRDILRVSPENSALREAKRKVAESQWVAELAAAQQPDGTWGRFHSQDAAVKAPFPTTEFAIHRALALGLDRHDLVLQKIANFIEEHIQGKAAWSDRMEKHDEPRIFPYNIRTISAAMLALIDRNHPLLDPFWQRWAKTTGAAFASGTYDWGAELAMQQQIAGFHSQRFLPFHMYYPLLILSSTRFCLPAELEQKMMDFLIHKPGGIYYVCPLSLDTFSRLDDRMFVPWLHGHEILARFESWKAYAPAVLNWVWDQRCESGLWDIGGAAARSYACPISASWRKPGARAVDCSVRILTLLRKFFD